MKNLLETTLADLVTQQTGAAVVLEKYQLDFCCKGKRTLEEACKTQGLDPVSVADELDAFFATSRETGESIFKKMPLDTLADYIVEYHHGYVRRMIPLLTAHTQKIAEKHGPSHPELLEIAKLWDEVQRELTQHMFKEEQILFPHIRRMVNIKKGEEIASISLRPFVASPIKIMEMEHEKAGDLLAKIRQLSNDYTPPLVACTTYRLCFNELREFEEDLHMHVYLENSLLFPKAIKLETDMLSGVTSGMSDFSTN